MNKQVLQHLFLCLPFCRDDDESWLGLSMLGNVFQWDDGTVVDYLPWDDGQPDYPEEHREFVVYQEDDAIRDRRPWSSLYCLCQMGTGSVALVDDQP